MKPETRTLESGLRRWLEDRFENMCSSQTIVSAFWEAKSCLATTRDFVAFTATTANAAPTPNSAHTLIVFNPRIITPKAGTTWSIGSTHNVTWETASIPRELRGSVGRILLGYHANGSENLDVAHPLATAFPLVHGSVTVTVPKNIKPRDDYFVVREYYDELDAGPVEQATSPPTNPYVTLPDPSTSYIQLRFQLVHFSGVYRTVKVPLNYTFANLHTLIQFLFGWSNSHLHVSQVYTHVTMYSTWGNKAWHMKRFGHPPSPPEWLLNDASDAARETYFWNLKHENAAFYRVEAMTTRRRRAKADNFGEGGDYRKRIEDQELTLAMVWDPVKNRNLTRGECENTELGIQYEYDFCGGFVY
ncbi:hypothetical protein H0H81_000745 [Sphagnurus paluster]|uniref:Plasmid pRiA4b Orf3-like domain-containing protein n=1 Tax=Sphagnurus paluster TaxID=117069 RepID=A0A9P7GI36_9AGAR|nr:hypothetical protein H0H81_000745 [Sphagnurus paluster]